MPVYQYGCESCGIETNAYRSVEQRNNSPRCPKCGERTEKVITAPMVRPEIQPFQSPIDGRPINSRQQWKEDMKRNNCRPWEGIAAEKAHAESIKKSDEAKFEKGVKAEASKVLGHMSADKQKILKNSLA